MRRQVYERRVLLPVSAAEAFAWHERRGAFLRLQPPWEHVTLLSAEGIRDGQRAELQMKIGPFTQMWTAEHRGYLAGRQFQDVQVRGPFAAFEHTHRITPQDRNSCWLIDHIEYELPGGAWGQVIGGRFVRSKLERVFRYRHHVTAADLALAANRKESSKMNVLVTGATGLVGTALLPLLTSTGHEAFRLMRSDLKEANDIPWDPVQGVVHTARMEGMDAVVHLAGENIAGKRWSADVKHRIRSSRVDGTRLLCEKLATLKRKPHTLVCASAIGIYGDRGSEILADSASAGDGFLAEVCRDWETACEPARQAGIRVVNLRIGVILSPRGGALKQMLLPFRLGAGGVVGTGRQYWSWIAIDDVIGAIEHCLTHREISGPVNVTAPNPATNYEFTKTLGAVLGRPTILPMPGLLARLALGEMANELLLSSTRVAPERLEASGYRFRCPTLEVALRHVLGAAE